MSGMKFDDGKLRWSLLRGTMTRALEGVLSVLEFGAKKYAKDSWLTVPDAKTRYRDALDRHLAAIDKGEEVDAESGKPHLFHVACNALFLAELGCRERTSDSPTTLARGGMSWEEWKSAVYGFTEHLPDHASVRVRTRDGLRKYSMSTLRSGPWLLNWSSEISWEE